MAIRAKFKCTRVSKNEDGSEHVELYAVSDKVNEQWAKWTPGGNLQMTINNPEAQGQIKPGGQYFIDIAEADPAA